MIATKDHKQIGIIKGIGSGTIALLISLITGISPFPWQLIPVSLLLGFISYGLSETYTISSGIYRVNVSGKVASESYSVSTGTKTKNKGNALHFYALGNCGAYYPGNHDR